MPRLARVLACVLYAPCLLFQESPLPNLAGGAPSAAFGAGCGRLGLAPALSSGPVGLGQPFVLEITGAATNRPALLLLGASNTTWLGQSLPLDLTAAGAPRCWLYCSGELQFGGTTDSAGNMIVRLFVPRDSGLSGGRLHSQVFVLDPAANALGLAVTNGLSRTVGAR